VAGALWGGAARADTPPERAALAEALFVEGKDLMRAGKLAEACPKLAESHRLDPGGGVVLALALCHEAAGKTASAWSTFGEALTFAVRDGDRNREAVARARIAALEPKLPRLVIVVAPAALGTAGLAVRLDGAELERPAWGTAMPVDPGDHHVEVSAPGKRTRHLVPAAQPSSTSSILVEGLEAEPAPPPPAPVLVPASASVPVGPLPPPPAPSSAEPPSSPLRPLGFAGIGLGAAGAVVGAGFLASAISQNNAANARCPGVDCSDLEAVELSRRAVVAGDVATGAFVGGALAAAAGVALLIAAPSPRGAPRRAWIAPGVGGALITGSF
jgi:hypothetical protein